MGGKERSVSGRKDRFPELPARLPPNLTVGMRRGRPVAMPMLLFLRWRRLGASVVDVGLAKHSLVTVPYSPLWT